MGAGLRCSCFRLPDFGGLRPKFFMVNLSGLPPFPTLVHPSGDSLGRGCCACWCCECACDAAAVGYMDHGKYYCKEPRK